MYLALLIYFTFLFGIVFLSSRKVKTSQDFVLGNRSLNYWLTAIAAHASDMSSWLFMGYPALIYASGLFNAWIALGLVICMWLNWQLIAMRFRKLTGMWDCATFSSFLHCRYDDKSGMLQLLSALFCFIFYVVYICSGLVGLGILGHSLFGVDYSLSILIGALIVVTYVIVGGFLTLAWIDFIQGIFLMTILCLTPIFIVNEWGGFNAIMDDLSKNPNHLKILPHTFQEAIQVFFMLLGWGLGYFGQPHIITKFMGIKNVDEIDKSKRIGMLWMILSLSAATVVGLVGIAFFKSLSDPQMVFIEMAKSSFSPFVIGFIFCAVLAATINVMSSQLLILGSIFSEDIYKRYSKNISSKKLLFVSRACIIVATFFALIIAQMKPGSIYDLVYYAWSGLGSAFGPLILVALYSKNGNKYGAYAAIIVGGTTTALWPLINPHLPVQIDALIPGFLFSFGAIFTTNYLTRHLKVKFSI
jgi:sodium/proline symporter